MNEKMSRFKNLDILQSQSSTGDDLNSRIGDQDAVEIKSLLMKDPKINKNNKFNAKRMTASSIQQASSR